MNTWYWEKHKETLDRFREKVFPHHPVVHIHFTDWVKWRSYSAVTKELTCSDCGEEAPLIFKIKLLGDNLFTTKSSSYDYFYGGHPLMWKRWGDKRKYRPSDEAVVFTDGEEI